MPLDPLAKRFLAMMAAASTGDRARPSPHDRRLALARLMQFARADVAAADGVTVVETTLRYPDFEGADEIFSSGNFAKVAPVIRIDDRLLQPGPFYSRARKLYWEFAHGCGSF